MDKLDLGDLTLNDDHLTQIELYGTKGGYYSLSNPSDCINILDAITTFKISGARTESQIPAFYNILLERTILRGVQKQHLTLSIISDLMLKLIYEKEGEGEFNPRTRFKPVQYPELVGQEFQFQYTPREAIDLTRQFREVLPDQLISEFTSHAQRAA
jgi:hypothetical protein